MLIANQSSLNLSDTEPYVESICGTCTRKIRSSHPKISCIQCCLDFHVDCVSMYSNTSFWCDSCFYRTCLNELPFCNEPFIDYNCKMSKVFSIAHLNIRSLRNKLDYVRVLLDKTILMFFA